MGRYFSKYGVSAIISLPITDEVSAHVGPDLRSVLLGLVEVYQRQKRWKEAITCLERLRRLEPEDVVVKLSLAELLLDPPAPQASRQADTKAYQRVVRLAEGIENEMSIRTALLLYKDRALRGLGLLDAARETLTVALRRKRTGPTNCFGRSGTKGPRFTGIWGSAGEPRSIWRSSMPRIRTTRTWRPGWGLSWHPEEGETKT